MLKPADIMRMPAPIKDARRPPLDRMKDLMVFARSLLPAGGGGLLGWALLPLIRY